MFTEEDQKQLNQLCLNNPELSKLLEKKEEEHNSILSSITHEMRNPLTLIYSTIQLIEKRNPEIIHLKYWEQLSNDVKDTISLLEEFSSFNHSQNIHLEPIDLSNLLKSTILSFQAAALEKQVDITFDIIGKPDNIIFEYPADSVKLKQVFINLIKNALEACKIDGKICIEINADISLLPTNINGITYIEITVSDDGEFIPAENINNIFTPFFTSKTDGTGLGLAITKKIVLAHHGMISVSSTEKKTTFCIYLPLDINSNLSFKYNHSICSKN